MKKASLFICLTILLATALGRCELSGQDSDEKKSFCLKDDPILLSLSQNAPHDHNGHLLPLPKLSIDSLSNPLQNRLALISEKGKFFTIVPKDSLLIGSHFRQASELIRQEMPNGKYLSLEDYLQMESSHFITIRIDSKSSVTALEDEFPDRLILLVDQITGLPVTQREWIAPNASSPSHPAQ